MKYYQSASLVFPFLLFLITKKDARVSNTVICGYGYLGKVPTFAVPRGCPRDTTTTDVVRSAADRVSFDSILSC